MDKFIINLLGFYCVLMLLVCILQYYIILLNNKKTINKVHFYVARDRNGELWLYISKPHRENDYFQQSDNGYVVVNQKFFYKFGLNEKDYDNIKCEDEPVEVFINLED